MEYRPHMKRALECMYWTIGRTTVLKKAASPQNKSKSIKLITA